jgi:hypothetical protein
MLSVRDPEAQPLLEATMEKEDFLLVKKRCLFQVRHQSALGQLMLGSRSLLRLSYRKLNLLRMCFCPTNHLRFGRGKLTPLADNLDGQGLPSRITAPTEDYPAQMSKWRIARRARKYNVAKANWQAGNTSICPGMLTAEDFRLLRNWIGHRNIAGRHAEIITLGPRGDTPRPP